MNPTELRDAIAYLDDCLRDLHQDEDGELRSLSDEEQERFDEGFALRQQYAADLDRHNTISHLAEVPETVEREAPQVIRTADPLDVIEDRSATRTQLADALTRSVEGLVDDPDNMAHVRQLARRHGSDREWVRNLVHRSTDDYAAAWSKYVTGNERMLTQEERTALSSGSNTNGGFLVPTHLDPTVILTNSGTSNVIRGISRTVTLTQPGDNSWQGVSSAGVTASWDGELTEVSDDSPTFAQPTVPLHVAQAFVQASISVTQDAVGLESDIMMMLADARDRLEGAAHATGSGSGQPTGIFTALDANTNVELATTTAATVGEIDVHNVYRQTPIRWRGRGTWLGHPIWLLEIKRLGDAVSSSFTGDFTTGITERILGRPVVESDDAPSTQTTTALDNVLIFGDFSNFVIVDKPGSMAVEYIPHLFNTATNLPDGRRGWFMHWRNGSDSVNDVAFRLLQDTTSA